MQIYTYGVTTFRIFSDKITIDHTGNMGASIQDVRYNVDRALGDGAFNSLRALGQEKGSPDYLYSLTIPDQSFPSSLKKILFSKKLYSV